MNRKVVDIPYDTETAKGRGYVGAVQLTTEIMVSSITAEVKNLNSVI